jgi:hypothetical protein
LPDCDETTLDIAAGAIATNDGTENPAAISYTGKPGHKGARNCSTRKDHYE